VIVVLMFPAFAGAANEAPKRQTGSTIRLNPDTEWVRVSKKGCNRWRELFHQSLSLKRVMKNIARPKLASILEVNVTVSPDHAACK